MKRNAQRRWSDSGPSFRRGRQRPARRATPGRFDFVPASEPLVLPISNPDRVAAAAVGPLLRVYGDLDPANGEISCGITGSTSRRKSRPVQCRKRCRKRCDLVDPLIDKLDTLVSGFAAKVNEALKPGAMSVEDLDPEGTGPIAVEDRRTTGQSPISMPGRWKTAMPQARSAIVERYANVREQLKAIYDTYDNYPPWSYEQIYRNANAVVAIGVPGASQAICSGVLVGQDLVLTAGHCFKFYPPDELEVWFDLCRGPGRCSGIRKRVRSASWLRRPGTSMTPSSIVRNSAGISTTTPSSASCRRGNDPHLIPRVSLPSCQMEPAESPPDDAAPEIQAQWQDMREEWQTRCIRSPQCLLRCARQARAASLRRGLSQRGRARRCTTTVGCTCRTNSPANDFDELKLEIEADYKEHPEREAILKQFTDSYVLRDRQYFLEDVRVYWPAEDGHRGRHVSRQLRLPRLRSRRALPRRHVDQRRRGPRRTAAGELATPRVGAAGLCHNQ